MSVPGTILLVDDSPDDLDLMQLAFRSLGVENPVDICTDGLQAVNYLTAGYNPRPVLILLDLRMPGFDGFAFLHRIKSDPRLKDINVVVLSNSISAHDIHRAYEFGANAYVRKPGSYAELKRLVAEMHRVWVAPGTADQSSTSSSPRSEPPRDSARLL